MRASPKDQRLEALEAEFNALLIPCLKECANGDGVCSNRIDIQKPIRL